MRDARFSIWAGTILLLTSGVIHIYNAPAEYSEAQYLGIMFIGAFIGSLIASLGIVLKKPLWGWGMGALIAIGSLIGYVLSRTVGLPISGVEPWGPFLGYLSLVVEVGFIIFFARTQAFNQLISKMIPRRSA